MGDFNLEPMEETMSNFMGLYDLKNLPCVSICYKKPQNPSYLNLFRTDKHLCFKDIFETALSDFHELVVRVTKT